MRKYRYYVILVTTGQYKTQTTVGRPYLVCSPRFTPESLFYTQWLMLSPRFIPQSVFYTQSVVCSPQSVFYTNRNPAILDRVTRDKRLLLRRYLRRRTFITKTCTLILFTNKSLDRLGFGGTGIEHFSFPKQ